MLDNKAVLEKVDRLKRKFAGSDREDLDQIASWEKMIKSAILKSSLAENDAFKAILVEIEKKIEDCNFVLMNDRSLSERDRDKIFERRDSWQWFKNLFNIENTIGPLVAEIDKNLYE